MKFLTDIQIEPLDYSHCRIGSCGRNAAHEVTAAYSDGTADMVRCCNDCLPQAIMGVAVYDCDLDESLVRAAGDLLAALEALVKDAEELEEMDGVVACTCSGVVQLNGRAAVLCHYCAAREAIARAKGV